MFKSIFIAVCIAIVISVIFPNKMNLFHQEEVKETFIHNASNEVVAIEYHVQFEKPTDFSSVEEDLKATLKEKEETVVYYSIEPIEKDAFHEVDITF